MTCPFNTTELVYLVKIHYIQGTRNYKYNWSPCTKINDRQVLISNFDLKLRKIFHSGRTGDYNDCLPVARPRGGSVVQEGQFPQHQASPSPAAKIDFYITLK